MTAAVFDRGYYTEILVKTMKGAPLVTKKVEQSVKDVPQWFIDSFPLATPRMNAIVMDGWIQAAQIEVVSHPGHAYSELYRISVRSTWVLLVVAVLSLVTVLVVLRLALKPLDDMEQQAINISKRQFTLLPKLPWARELHRVANAMNGMVVAVERMLTEQTDLAEKMRKKAYVDGVTGLMNRNDFAERLSHLIGAPTKLSAGVLAVGAHPRLRGVQRKERTRRRRRAAQADCRAAREGPREAAAVDAGQARWPGIRHPGSRDRGGRRAGARRRDARRAGRDRGVPAHRDQRHDVDRHGVLPA
jgi:hypothetical protein